jgi:DNA invertase Pin-like site-specific DNA recombinase
MQKAIGYTRVSTDEQAQSGLGLDAQRAAIVKHLGREPDEMHTDAGLHGDRPDRPGLLAAIDALHQGDTLIVAKRDRLARDMYLSCWIEKEVKRRGAVIVSAAGEGTDDEEPTSVLLRRIIDAFSEFERAMIRQRTSAAMARLRAKGKKTGGDPPYGWKYVDGVMIEDEEQRYNRLFILGRHKHGDSLSCIAHTLNVDGETTARGKPWTYKQIQRVIKYEERRQRENG